MRWISVIDRDVYERVPEPEHGERDDRDDGVGEGADERSAAPPRARARGQGRRPGVNGRRVRSRRRRRRSLRRRRQIGGRRHRRSRCPSTSIAVATIGAPSVPATKHWASYRPIRRRRRGSCGDRAEAVEQRPQAACLALVLAGRRRACCGRRADEIRRDEERAPREGRRDDGERGRVARVGDQRTRRARGLRRRRRCRTCWLSRWPRSVPAAIRRQRDE